MPNILDPLRKSLNEGHRLSGLQNWMYRLQEELKVLSEASQEVTTLEHSELAKKEFQERNAAFIAELLLSTPDHPRPCPLLEVFRNQASDQVALMGGGGLIEQLVGQFDLVFRDGEVKLAKESLLGKLKTLAGWTLRGLELRCATLLLVWRAMGEKDQSFTPKNCINSLITAYREYFSTDCWSEIPGSSVYRSAGLHRLSEIASQRIQSSDKKTDAAKTIASAIEASRFATSHRDPAVAFVCDTLALALGYPCGTTEPLGKGWQPGDTWVLLGAKDSAASSGTGVVLRLRTQKVELHPDPARLQEMCPAAFYPDPRLAAHCPIDEDFQIGIRNAWITTMHKSESSGKSHDFCWQLAAIDRSDDHVQRRIIGMSGLKGDSGTLAYAVALRSCEEGTLTRQDTACTAAFDTDLKSKRPLEDANYTNPKLRIVGLVADKAKAASGNPLTSTQLTDLWKHGQPAFANKIKRIIVAPNQPLEFPPELKLVPVSEWDIASRELNDAEALIAQFAKNAAARWDQIRISQPTDHSKNFIDRRLNDIHRFDLYRPPEFQWEDPNPKHQAGRVAGESPWITTKLDSPRENQLIEVLRFGVDKKLGLVLLDSAGAGKTVTSFKIQQLLSDPTTSRTIFGDNLPRLVFHWSSKLPTIATAEEPLVQLLAADESLLKTVSSPTEAEKIVRYALAEKRVVVIVDAFDELKDKQPELIKKAFRESLKTGNVFWIFTGRDYAINSESARGGIFQPDAFRRLRICPFISELQDEYMKLALPGREKKLQSLLWHTHRNNPEITLRGLPYRIQDTRVREFLLGRERIDCIFSFVDNHQATMAAGLLAQDCRTIHVAVGTLIRKEATAVSEQIDVRLFEARRGCASCVPWVSN